MSKIHTKSKRVTIFVIDVIIAGLLGVWASNTFPKHNQLIEIGFGIAFILRIGLDFLVQTVEEEFYEKFIKDKMAGLEATIRFNEIIRSQMLESLEKKDFKGFKIIQKYIKEL